MSNERLYDQLRGAIASGEIQPLEPLVEADLMQRFGVGRPAVRVALVRLEQEGLVEREPNRSARVRLLGRDEALEIYEARILLETYAVGRAAQRATPAETAELRALLDEIAASRESGLFSHAADLDMRLHRRFLEIAGNRTIMRMHEGLHSHLVRYRDRLRLEQESSQSSLEEHRRIVDALAASDPDAASRLMKEHLESLLAALQSILKEE